MIAIPLDLETQITHLAEFEHTDTTTLRYELHLIHGATRLTNAFTIERLTFLVTVVSPAFSATNFILSVVGCLETITMPVVLSNDDYTTTATTTATTTTKKRYSPRIYYSLCNKNIFCSRCSRCSSRS